jgi:hypothetical protein
VQRPRTACRTPRRLCRACEKWQQHYEKKELSTKSDPGTAGIVMGASCAYSAPGAAFAHQPGGNSMAYLNQILFLIGLVVFMGWVLTRRYYNVDLDRHKASDPPTDAQIRWHILNIRRDISTLAVTNFGILLVLIFALVLKL